MPFPFRHRDLEPSSPRVFRKETFRIITRPLRFRLDLDTECPLDFLRHMVSALLYLGDTSALTHCWPSLCPRTCRAFVAGPMPCRLLAFQSVSVRVGYTLYHSDGSKES